MVKVKGQKGREDPASPRSRVSVGRRDLKREIRPSEGISCRRQARQLKSHERGGERHEDWKKSPCNMECKAYKKGKEGDSRGPTKEGKGRLGGEEAFESRGRRRQKNRRKKPNKQKATNANESKTGQTNRVAGATEEPIGSVRNGRRGGGRRVLGTEGGHIHRKIRKRRRGQRACRMPRVGVDGRGCRHSEKQTEEKTERSKRQVKTREAEEEARRAGGSGEKRRPGRTKGRDEGLREKWQGGEDSRGGTHPRENKSVHK